jgi:hypothetical protein
MEYIKYPMEGKLDFLLRNHLLKMTSDTIFIDLEYHLTNEIWGNITNKAGQVTLYDKLKLDINEQESNGL